MSLFTETLEILPQQDCMMTESGLTLSPEDSLANLTAWLVNALRKMTSGTSGENAKEYFARFGPDGQLLKMCQGYCQVTLDGSFEGFSGALPKQGMMRAGSLMALPTLGRRSKGTGCLLWRTPSASDANHSVNSADSNGCLHLTAQVHWPTPRANDAEKRGAIANDPRNGLPAAVMWPTPTVPNGGRQPKGGMSLTGMTPDGKKRQVDLNYAVKNWPTPKGRDWKCGGAKSEQNRNTPDLNTSAKMYSATNGALNADWVELLMNYPVGWTDIDCDNPAPWPGWPMGQGDEQYEYEPPRVITGQKNRAKRLKGCGNSVVPQQAYPIFAAIKQIEQEATP